MRFDKSDLLLYAVTDRSWLEGESLYGQVEKALIGGATLIQLREKNLDELHFMEEARAIQLLCRRYRVPFVINDNVEIAQRMDADGVHVGQQDMEAGEVRKRLGADKIIGVSAHSVEEALLAERCGADYLGVGAVFSTSSKPDANVISHGTLKEICEAVKIPVVAIGGIGQNNILKLKGSGASGVAVISSIFAQPNIIEATRALRSLSEKMTGTRNIEGAIFDMDGTLLDSMPVWEHVSEKYLARNGIKAEENLSEILFSLSMEQGAAYIKKTYQLEQNLEEIVAGVNAIAAEAYETSIPLKKGAAELLEKLAERGIKMAVATSTDRPLAEAALKRTGIYDYFEQIFTCTEVGAGKVRPDIFDAARNKLGSRKCATWVFEDAQYAIETARAAGYRTVGIYDERSKKVQSQIAEAADIYLENIGDFLQ